MPERIEQLISSEALAQFDQLAIKLDQCTANFEKLIAEGVRLNNTLGNTKGIKEVNSAFNEIGSSEKDIVRNTTEMAAVQDKLTKALLKRLAVEKELAATRGGSAGAGFTSNIAALQKEQDALKKTGTAVNALDAEQAAAANSATAFAGATRNLSTETKKHIVSLEQKLRAEREAAKLAATRAYLDRQQAAELKNQIREEIAIKGSLEQRRAALIRLTAAYDNLTAAERASAQGQRLQGVVAGLTTQVKGLETATGRAQRNVGNYAEAGSTGFARVGAAAGKAFGFIRQIAYVLPGIGVAGIFSLITDGIVSAATAMFGLGDAAEETKHEVSGIATAIGDSTADIAKVRVLAQTLLDTNQSLDTRNHALQELKTLNKDYFGDLEIEGGLYDTLTQKVGDYARALILANVQKAKGEELTKASIEEQDLREQIGDLDEIISRRTHIAVTTSKNLQADIKARGLQDLAQAKSAKDLLSKDAVADAAIRKRIGLYDKLGDATDKVGKLTISYENAIKSSLQFDPLKAPPETKTKTESIRDNPLFKARIEMLKELSKSDQLEMKDRIALLKQATDMELQLVKKGSQAEIDILNDQKLAKFIIEVSAAKRERDLFAETNEQALAQFKAAEDARTKLEETSIKDRLEKRVNNLNEDKDILLTSLEREETVKLRAAHGEKERNKIVETYQKARLKLELDTDRYILLATLETQKELLKFVEDPKLQDALKAKIAELERKLAELGKKSLSLNVDPAIENLSKVAEGIASIKVVMDATFGLIGGAVNASIITEKNLLQDRADQIDKNAAREIDAVNATTDSQEKKAARIQIIQAKQQVQREEIDRRQRQLQMRQAEFDKAKTISDIILSTAAAVVAQLRLPHGIFLAAIIAAMGAAQLAIAVATPLPHFETGTMDAPGGDVVVGEKRSELVVTPEGRLMRTPSTPTVMNVPKHSIIFSDARRAMEAGIGRGMTANVNWNDQRVVDVIRDEMKQTRKAIINKKENHFYPRKDGWHRIVKNGNNRTDYLNENLQW